MPVRRVILYPNSDNIPIAQTTPVTTISTGTITALKDLKKIKRTIIHIVRASTLNRYNSFLIFIELTTLI
jgi:hypothetical protein